MDVKNPMALFTNMQESRLEVATLVTLFCQHKFSHCNDMEFFIFFSSHSINFKVLL